MIESATAVMNMSKREKKNKKKRKMAEIHVSYHWEVLFLFFSFLLYARFMDLLGLTFNR
jgi:hypothetical protein